MGSVSRIPLREAVAVQLQMVVHHIPAALARQVEVGVVCEVHHRISLRPGGVAELQRVVRRQGIADLHVQGAGVSLLAVRAAAAEDQAVPGGLRREQRRAVDAVEVVAAVVFLQLVCLSVEREGPPL